MMDLMASYHHKPAPPLSDFIELLWLYRDYHQPHKKERLLPDGSMELVINLTEDRVRLYDPLDTEKYETLRGSLVVGPHSDYFVIDTAQQRSVLGVHFKPGGAFPFLGLPVNELHNRSVSLDELWGGWADQLRTRLLEDGTPHGMFRILEQTLLARWSDRQVAHPAVVFAVNEFYTAPHVHTIADVTGLTGLSPKRFIQVFNDQVGLTPKLFCRVRRFQRVLRTINAGRTVGWVDIAADCGYFDQAHFIRDFRAFSGINPSAYVRQRTEHLNHVPLPG